MKRAIRMAMMAALAAAMSAVPAAGFAQEKCPEAAAQSKAESKEASETGVEEEDLHVLIPHAADIRFEYFRMSGMDDAPAGPKTAPGTRSARRAPARPDRQRAPVDPGEENVFVREAGWDPEVEQINPEAVGVSIRMDDASDPVRILVPLPGENRP